MTVELLGLIVVAAIVAVLVILLVRLGKSDFSVLANHMAKKTRQSFDVLKPCPICHTMLHRGENVHSVVYGKEKEDRIAHIFGCPYCYPANDEHPRICPVCKERVPLDGYLFARMFERGTRKHVHVLGCTRCRGPKKRPVVG